MYFSYVCVWNINFSMIVQFLNEIISFFVFRICIKCSWNNVWFHYNNIVSCARNTDFSNVEIKAGIKTTVLNWIKLKDTYESYNFNTNSTFQLFSILSKKQNTKNYSSIAYLISAQNTILPTLIINCIISKINTAIK